MPKRLKKVPERLKKSTRSATKVDGFQEQLSAYMAKLGSKGGAISGSRRMQNLTADQRRDIALKAARTRWKIKPTD